MTNTAQIYLKYANLQMASEAFLTDGMLPPDLQSALERGNDHASKFTTTLATGFALDWTVVDHQPNTSTGFSATLFKCNKSDPARGLTAGEYVISFRSTEFIDDALCDNQARVGWAE